MNLARRADRARLKNDTYLFREMKRPAAPRIKILAAPPIAGTIRIDAVAVADQYIGANHILTTEASWIHEFSTNSSALVGTGFSKAHDSLDRFALTTSYYYRRTYGVMFNFNAITGSSDQLLYCSSATLGPINNCNGSPTAMWETFELVYMLRLNIRLFLQYNLYNRLDSGANAFAGYTNPKPTDNDTLVAGLWLAF